MDYERKDHQHSGYERHSCEYRCGRERFWRQPCWQGPDVSGRCGGASDCSPIQREDRYYCQRPERGGGPCQEGPLPDGRCSHQHRACAPKSSLRRWRGRITLLTLLALTALILLYSSREPGPLQMMLNPGPLMGAHAGLLEERGCETCHQNHNAQGWDWFRSAFHAKDLSPACLECHQFGGDGMAAHNQRFPDRPELDQVECRSCHQDHLGPHADLTRVDEATCAVCHEPSFRDFSAHVNFADNYPHEQPGALFFDHASHLGQYFSDPDWTGKPNRDAAFAGRARDDCTQCHLPDLSARSVPVRDYEQICANCHDHQLRGRPLVLLNADGPTEPLAALALDYQDDDEALAALLQGLNEGGLTALMEQLEGAELPEGLMAQLFAGLNDGQLRQVSGNWREQEDYSGPEALDPPWPGWQVAITEDGDEALLYRPRGHRDRLLKTWLDYFTQATGDEANTERREEAMTLLMDADEGPGACGKCHAALASGDGRWAASDAVERPLSPGFNHRPHLNLLGPNGGCQACHQISDDAGYPAYYESLGQEPEAYQSDFNGVTLQRCSDCHGEAAQVSAPCSRCHRYHIEPGFSTAFKTRLAEDQTP